jgi:hypothetical protein
MEERGEFIELYRTMDRGHIALVKSIFEANNIRYFIESENFIRVPAIIKVDKEQLKNAEELLKDLKRNKEDDNSNIAMLENKGKQTNGLFIVMIIFTLSGIIALVYAFSLTSRARAGLGFIGIISILVAFAMSFSWRDALKSQNEARQLRNKPQSKGAV